MNLREAKGILRMALWTATDEKLAEMLAWAQDGKMLFADTCGCFAGCLRRRQLHQRQPMNACYYNDALHENTIEWVGWGGYHTESGAYQALGFNDAARLVRIVAIIKAQIRLRDRAAASNRIQTVAEGTAA